MPVSLEPFHGEEKLAAAPERVFAALTDLEALARVLPGFVSCERIPDSSPPAVRAVVRPGLSFLHANLRLTLTLAQTAAPDTATIRIAAQSIGVSMQVESCIRIEPASGHGGASTVRWEARIGEMSGLITAVGPTLIRAAADKVIRDAWEGVRRRVET
jgi:carbon monoxide dehydrogenase subunit G